MADPKWPSENELQAAIMRFLMGVVVPTGRGFFYRQSVLKGMFYGFGQSPEKAYGINTGHKGLPDIGGIFDSKPWYCEVKLPGQQPDSHQREMMEYLKVLGAVVIVAHSVSDVEQATIPRRDLLRDDYDYSQIPF